MMKWISKSLLNVNFLLIKGLKFYKSLYVNKTVNIILLLVSILIGVILSETIFRNFLKIKYQFKENLPGMRIYPYPGLAYDMEECQNCIIKINSLGLRGNNINISKPENTIRILILGDSATFGANVENDEETIPGRLGKRLMEEPYINKRFEVINGGIPGYDIQEIYLHYKYKLKQLNSDIVIYNFFPNDFLNSKFSIEKINGKPTLVRYVNAETPGLQMLSFMPERLNIFLNQYSLLYRYLLYYLSQLTLKDTSLDALKYIGKFQDTNLKYLDILREEIKKDNSEFIISSEIYSFCANCKEPITDQNCPLENGCNASYFLIKWVEKYSTHYNIPFVYLSEAVSDMYLKEVMVDNLAHYTGKANIIMADKLYEFLKPIITEKFK